MHLGACRCIIGSCFCSVSQLRRGIANSSSPSLFHHYSFSQVTRGIAKDSSPSLFDHCSVSDWEEGSLSQISISIIAASFPSSFCIKDELKHKKCPSSSFRKMWRKKWQLRDIISIRDCVIVSEKEHFFFFFCKCKCDRGSSALKVFCIRDFSTAP